MWARVPHPGSRPKNSRVIGLTTWVVNRRRNQSLVVEATVPPLLARSRGVCHRDLDHRCVPRSNVPPARPEIVTSRRVGPNHTWGGPLRASTTIQAPTGQLEATATGPPRTA